MFYYPFARSEAGNINIVINETINNAASADSAPATAAAILRDLMQALDVCIRYDADKKAITLDTIKGYDAIDFNQTPSLQ